MLKRNSIRNQNRRRRRKKIIERKRDEFIELSREVNDIDVPEDMFNPLDHTDYEWKDQEKKICPKGLKFVPTIKRHNEAKKFEDHLKFCRKLRLAVFFHRLEKQKEQRQDNAVRVVSEEVELEKPWTKPSDFNPRPGDNGALELFLLQVECCLFDPRNARKVKDNLTQVQRNALKSLSS